ncbi:hypothetical protein [Pseudoxanthomonas sp.]|uniref:hypothetical protein n=1 Tax=Pseudoxanthomonas sp. TaxID=1871049 RepID=UPI00260804BC|nr:hypothetical protein [Pseudoxanthomonas sp.]WDS36207.1 MAG: hypothetical protein O8I58_18380 [Pseudoxanthomonas sp.]
MNAAALNFDLYAMTKPKTRQDAMLVAREIIDQLTLIEECIDRAIAGCEASRLADLAR